MSTHVIVHELLQDIFLQQTAFIFLSFILSRNFLTSFDPRFQQVNRLSTLQRCSCQLTSVRNRISKTIDITSNTSIQNNGIPFGIRVTSTQEDLFEFFGVFLWSSTLEVNQFTTRNTNVERIKLKGALLVYLGFALGSDIFNLQHKQQ